MTTITLYRVSSGYRNVTDGVSLRDPGYERRVWARDYILPDGYEVADTVYGEQMLYDAEGRAWEPCLTSNASNAGVALAGSAGFVALKRAKPEQVTRTALATLRKQAGLTQLQLSELSGVNARQIRRVELGESEAGNLTATNFLALADALGVDPHELL